MKLKVNVRTIFLLGGLVIGYQSVALSSHLMPVPSNQHERLGSCSDPLIADGGYALELFDDKSKDLGVFWARLLQVEENSSKLLERIECKHRSSDISKSVYMCHGKEYLLRIVLVIGTDAGFASVYHKYLVDEHRPIAALDCTFLK